MNSSGISKKWSSFHRQLRFLNKEPRYIRGFFVVLSKKAIAIYFRKMEVDIVYVLGRGSKWANNELRYSLRSVLKHGKNIRKIWIIGEKPDFIKFDDTIKHISFADSFCKTRNIWEKLRYAAEHYAISENFLFFNDDHFMLSIFDAKKFKYYVDGRLYTCTSGNQLYQNLVKTTIKALLNKELHTFNYDIHSPMMIHSESFRLVYKAFFEEITSGASILVKSVYANAFHHPSFSPTLEYDLKINEPLSLEEISEAITYRKFFSIGDQGINDAMKSMLDRLFPQPSYFEIV